MHYREIRCFDCRSGELIGVCDGEAKQRKRIQSLPTGVSRSPRKIRRLRSPLRRLEWGLSAALPLDRDTSSLGLQGIREKGSKDVGLNQRYKERATSTK